MHMPKRNLFAYICATGLGACIILLAFRGQFDDLLGNIILGNRAGDILLVQTYIKGDGRVKIIY